MERIGLMVGWEDTFPPAFIERVNREPGIRAEIAKIGGTPEKFEPPYRVLIDRISHEVEHYRMHLKAAQLAGTYVINDPLWWQADDKFFGFSLVEKLGVATPRTVLLPQQDYLPSIDKSRSLRNLEFPLDWEGITEYVGFPAFLKPANGGGWKNVSKVDNMRELLTDYNKSGLLPMTLQEFIDFDDYVRCICIGREFILPIRYDPKKRCYLADENYLEPKVAQRVVDDAWKICNALGYDMNSVEFAIKDGVPYAIDFTNPAPDMDRWSVTDKYFNVCVEEMARFVIKIVKEGRKPELNKYRFGDFLPGGPRAGELGPVARNGLTVGGGVGVRL
ncbi:MAG: hypothetical protein Q8Q09_21070 [Deltaproteobacteria bacterium]|nr:hypothetical protein [Deltaproteobacteria bacterium]